MYTVRHESCYKKSMKLFSVRCVEDNPLAWRSKSGQRGFTVIETVVASAIVLTAMAGCFLVMEASMNLLRSTRDGYAATTITNARLERARTIAYTSLPGLGESNTIVDDYGLPSTTGRFRRNTLISTTSIP